MKQLYTETLKVGKRGVFTIPAGLRKHFGIADGSLLIAEEREDGILLRPAIATPVETYSAECAAEFLLNNATDASDYESARLEVMGLGLNPDSIPHRAPAG